MMNKIFNKFNIDKFGWSLALSLLFYFLASRMFQDWFYDYKGLNIRPDGLFKSLGETFLIAEPLEIYFYLAAFLVIPALAFFIYPIICKTKLPNINVNKKYVLKSGFLILGLGVIALALKLPWEAVDSYVLSNGLSKLLWLIFTKRLFVVYILLALTIIFLIWFYWFEKREWCEKIFNPKLEKFIRIAQPSLALFLAFLIFNPNFPVDTHHYNYFLGAVNDVFQGKALLYETSHLYGLFDIYFLILVFKLIPLSYPAFSLIITIFFFLFFGGIYVFIKKWLNSGVLAFLGSGIIVALIYFFQVSPTRSALFFPNMSPFRWGAYVIVLFFILGFSRTKKKKYIHLSLLASVIAFFWNYDSGAFLSLATIGTFAFFYLTSGRNYVAVIKLLLYYLFYFAGVFILINLVNLGVYGGWPNWALFFRETDEFVLGAGMYPLPAVGIYQIFIFTYITALLFAVNNLWHKKSNFDLVLLFITLLGAGSAIYYIGESTWQLLYVITVPFVLILLYAFKNFRDWKIVRLGFLGLLFFSALLLLFKLPVEFSNRDYSRIIPSLQEIDPTDQDLFEDAQLIKEQYPQTRLPLVHLDDTKFLIYSEKSNYFDFYYMFTVYFEQDLQTYIDQILSEQPPVILVGQKKDDRIEYFLNGLDRLYQPTISLRTLDIYTLENN